MGIYSWQSRNKREGKFIGRVDVKISGAYQNDVLFQYWDVKRERRGRFGVYPLGNQYQMNPATYMPYFGKLRMLLENADDDQLEAALAVLGISMTVH